MEMPFKSANEITAMAASCFPLARAAATGIEQDVLELVVPEAKRDAKALLAILRRGAIFEKGVLAMLHAYSGVSAHSFRQHAPTYSGVSAHL
ncbi:hypothetical protein [Sulfitobacter sp.]|uniref:hypothetical protein n=1 Tax=Sulfitobacter sp. TaxID=1903071 RepID=UPI0025DAAFB1|nr:hypothetical protein [Sulfitobacter sp.]